MDQPYDEKFEECIKDIDELYQDLGDVTTLLPKYSKDMLISALEEHKRRIEEES